jgi:hypothetical protein
MMTPPTLARTSNENKTGMTIQKNSLENAKGELTAHSLTLLSRIMTYTGIFALITAITSVFFMVTEKPGNKKFGECVGNCYVLAEVALIVLLTAFIALKVFAKLRG